MTTTWRKLISGEMRRVGETWDDCVAMTLEEHELDIEFYDWVGGKPFTLWTAKRVYFPTDYDGEEDVRSAPRDPCDEPTHHVGCGAGGDWRNYNREWVDLPEKYRHRR